MSVVKRISMDSIVSRSAGLLIQEIDDCLVLTNGAGNYYGLELRAKRIWQFLDHPKTVEDLCGVLVKAYDVEQGRCEDDVLEFLGELNREGLVEIV